MFFAAAICSILWRCLSKASTTAAIEVTGSPGEKGKVIVEQGVRLTERASRTPAVLLRVNRRDARIGAGRNRSGYPLPAARHCAAKPMNRITKVVNVNTAFSA